MSETKIIAIDDDPTGSQTVHSCLLLTRWDVETLIGALQDESPLFFILSNTRGMDAARAAEVTRDICVSLKHALDELQTQGRRINPIVVSRSDSTLRGHYPVETDIIAEQLGPFDALFMVPAFFEAGRFTRDSIHYLVVDGNPLPVHETEFARDSVFGFSTACLPDYVEEKTAGRIRETLSVPQCGEPVNCPGRTTCAARQCRRYGALCARPEIRRYSRLRALPGKEQKS
jgi:uncharacterized protein YgbK (DUF1537 family)